MKRSHSLSSALLRPVLVLLLVVDFCAFSEDLSDPDALLDPEAPVEIATPDQSELAPELDLGRDPEQAVPLPPLPSEAQVAPVPPTELPESLPLSDPYVESAESESESDEHPSVDESTVLYSEIPPWDRAHNSIGIGLEYGFMSPINRSTGSMSGTFFRQALVSVDWLPLGKPTYGELALGGHIGFQYGTTTKYGVALADAGAAGVVGGAQVRYGFRFWNLQPVVPVVAVRVAYAYEKSGDSQLLYAPMGGLWVYLNFFDRRLASEMYTDSGVSKTYLTAEAQYVLGRGDESQIQALNILVGLRFEI